MSQAVSRLVVRRVEPSAAKPYRFNVEDQSRYRHRFWRLPRSRIDELARLSAPALVTLAALAIHVWPKTNESDYTFSFDLSVRRIAALTGFDKNTVVKALRELQAAEWIKYEGGSAMSSQKAGRFCVSARAYPRGGEEATGPGEPTFAMVTASLFYGGWMRVIPSPSAKKLLIVAIALVHVQDERAYLDAADNEVEDWRADRRDALSGGYDYDERFLDEVSEVSARPFAEIQRIARVGATTLRDAWHRIVAENRRDGPFPFPPIVEGRDPRGRVFLRRNDAALTYQFPPELLNDRKQVKAAAALLRSQRAAIAAAGDQ